MSRVQCKARYPVARNLFHWDYVTRRNITIVVNAPSANRFPGATADNHPRRRIDPEVTGVRNLTARPANNGFWRDVSTGRTVKNQKRVIEIHDQEIMERINGDRRLVTDNQRTWPLENPFWRHVAVGQPVEYENGGQAIS